MSAAGGSEVVFIENPGWMDRVLEQPEGETVLHFIATEALQNINEDFPVVTGEAQEWFIETEKVTRGGPKSVKIVTGDAIWHIIEFGSVNNPPYHPIANGMADTGLEFQEF